MFRAEVERMFPPADVRVMSPAPPLERVRAPESAILFVVNVWEPIVVPVIKDATPVPNILQLVSVIATSELPLPMLVVPVPVVFMFVVPVTLSPAFPVRRPADVIVPVPVVVIFPVVEILSPAVAGERVVPDLSQYPMVPEVGAVVVRAPDAFAYTDLVPDPASPPKVIVPSASRLEEPMSMFPKFEVILPESSAPTVVKLDVRTPVPRVLFESTLVPFIE